MHSARTAQRKHAISLSTINNVTDSTQDEDIVTVLRDQPKAFASDLGDEQSRYLYTVTALIFDKNVELVKYCKTNTKSTQQYECLLQ